jgi:protein-S-isoprenylcysteine O-methyltransferase Ste14
MHDPPINKAADFAGRVALVGLFAALAAYQTAGLIAHLQAPGALDLLDIATRLASIAYVALVVGLTIIRLNPVGSAAGWEPRLSAVAGSFLAVGLVALPQPDVGTTLRMMSLALIVVGLLLSAGVLLWLGRAFSVTAQARQLVATGPYALVRHPLYLCEEITVLGVALVHLSPTAALIVALQWMFQLRRMANEEKVLAAAFPEYATYAARTPRIIPSLFPRNA